MTSHAPDDVPAAGPSQGGVQGAFAQLSTFMLSERSLDQTLLRVAQLAQQTMAHARGASVTMIDANEQAGTVAFTGSLALDLDQMQYELDSGPCLEAARTRKTILVDHGGPRSPYPEFSQAALAAGVSHTLSVGLELTGDAIGGLNIYASTDLPVDPSSIRFAQALANYAGIAIARLVPAPDATDHDQLEKAIATRALVDQAKSLLVAQRGYAPENAMQELLSRSRQDGRRLAEIASSLVKDGAGRRSRETRELRPAANREEPQS
jgi:GAF domain-containing protein